MAQNGNLALNQTGYAITEFEMNGKQALVHREQVEQEAPAFSLAGEQSQKRIQSYNAVQYGIPIYGFGRKRITPDATGFTDPKDFLRLWHASGGVNIFPNVMTLGLLNQAVTGEKEVIRGSCEFQGEFVSLWDTSDETPGGDANNVVSREFTGSSTTWENGEFISNDSGASNEGAVGFDLQNIGDAMVAIVGGLVKSGSSPTVRDIMIQYVAATATAWQPGKQVDLLTNVPTANEDIDGGLVAPVRVGGEAIAALWNEDTKKIAFYSATTDLANWSAEIATIPAPTGVKGIAVMTGPDGAEKVYVGTDIGLYEVDTSASTWTFSRVHTPPFAHADNYRRMTVHRFRGHEAIWFGLGGDIQQPAQVGVLYVSNNAYATELNETQEGIFLGPAAGDGCEAVLYGPIRWWKSAGRFLFAAVGGQAGRYGWIMRHDGYGWSPVYVHDTANKSLYWLDVSAYNDSVARLHFAIRTGTSTTAGFVLERPMTPPTDGQTYTFEVSTAIDRPEYDLGLPRVSKALLTIYGDYINLGEKDDSENYVNVDYWSGAISGSPTNGGDFDEDSQEITLGSGAGVAAKSFAFRENLIRETGTTTTSPQSRGLEVNVFAKIPAVQRFTFMIDLEDSCELTGRNLKEVQTNLYSARDSNTLIQLQYGEMTAVYVDVKQMQFYDQYDAQGSDAADTASPRGGQCLVVCEEVIA